MRLGKVEKFEEFLEESFGEGVYSRELRLSKEEMEYVRVKYPKARMSKCLTTESTDGKCWVDINLLTPIDLVVKSENPNGLAAIQTENMRLKQELERIKKSLGDVGMY
jgi:hypothetical protein